MSTATQPQTNGRPALGERTGGQIRTLSLPLGMSPLPASYETYRKIRHDPTIALARALAAAPIIGADWSLEAADDAPPEAVEFITEQFMPIREPLIEAALYGGCDFGHQPWEKVFELDPTGLLRIAKFKPLLHDINELVIDAKTGAFRGFRNAGILVPVENCLLVYFRVEGTNWYGEPLMENAREVSTWWQDANKGAVRYDKKVAGSHWVVRYPEGQSPDEMGAVRPNWEIANAILLSLESSGTLAIPDYVVGYTEKLNQGQQRWKIELLSDSGGQQPLFIERLRYLDSLKCRAMLIPERSILEGQYGTKAEAGEQIDLALTNADLTHRHITRLVNWHAVDQLLALNWGEEWRGKVWLEAAPIRDAKLAFLREVYQAVLANPGGFLEEFSTVDTDSLKDSLGVPKSDTVAQAGEEPKAAVPLPGAEARTPQAALTRRLYAGLHA